MAAGIVVALSDVQNLGGTSAFAGGGGGGSTVIKRALIDFGSTSDSNVSAVITDAAISPTSIVIGGVYYDPTLLTSRSVDELVMGPVIAIFEPGSGQVTVHLRALTDTGTTTGEYTVWYMIGVGS